MSKFETTAKSVYSQPKESKKRYEALKRFRTLQRIVLSIGQIVIETYCVCGFFLSIPAAVNISAPFEDSKFYRVINSISLTVFPYKPIGKCNFKRRYGRRKPTETSVFEFSY